MAKTPAILCLDIEDPITMRSHRATQWITQNISEAGLVARPDLDLQWIERDTRLLSWTYKPAWTEEELSQI